MFRCALCHRLVPPRTPARRLVLEARPRTYPFRPRVNRVVRLRADGRRRIHWHDDPGGRGAEAVREVLVCPACAGGGHSR